MLPRDPRGARNLAYTGARFLAPYMEIFHMWKFSTHVEIFHSAKNLALPKIWHCQKSGTVGKSDMSENPTLSGNPTLTR